MGYGPWRMAGHWAKYARARCPPVAGCWCGVLPSHWICMAEIPPHSCVKRKMVRRGLWALRAEDRGSAELEYTWDK
jgi:hypothetical protein